MARELQRPASRDGARHFSGGRRTKVQQGRIKSLTVSNSTIRNVPITMLPLRQLSQSLGAKRIDGIIGTTLFYHSLATLDFPRGELVLRRKSAANVQAIYGVRGQLSVATFLDRKRPFHGGLGRVEALPPTLLRRHRLSPRRNRAGGVGDQGSRDQAGGGQSLERGRAAAGR